MIPGRIIVRLNLIIIRVLSVYEILMIVDMKWIVLVITLKLPSSEETIVSWCLIERNCSQMFHHVVLSHAGSVQLIA